MLRAAFFTLPLIALPALGQTSTFDIVSGPRTIGHASYTIAPAKSGFRVVEKYSYRLMGFDSQFTEEMFLGPAGDYVTGFTSNIGTQLHTSYTPNKPHTDLVIGLNQGGAQDARHIPIRPSFVLLPPYDPAAVQVILTQATTHPTPDNLYNVFIAQGDSGKPSGGEGGSGGSGRTSSEAMDAQWKKGPTTTGTLNGKDISVQAYVLAGGKATTVIYADENNQLLQADALALKVSYIRAGFKVNDFPESAKPAPSVDPK